MERSTDLFSIVSIFSKDIKKRDVEQEQIPLCKSAKAQAQYSVIHNNSNLQFIVVT